MRRTTGLVLCALLGTPAILSAQYFGQNHVQYTSFDWKVIQTEHFNIHYYERERTAALDAARIAERSYARLSRVLHHQFRERKPILLYASHSDFQQTNALGEEPSEATGGVTDFLKHRMVLPFTGSYAELEHVMQHEMVHQFQYDVWSRGHPGAGLQTLIQINPPLWFTEGMAEYLSIGEVDPNTAMWLRDAALTGKLPTIDQLENDPRIFPYRFGQALVAYIGERWGDEAIGAILQGTLSGGGGLEGAVRRTIGINLEQLGEQWRDAVQKRYLPEVADKEKARAFATEILSEKRSEGTLHLAPALSPDGSQIAYFSEKNFFFVDLYLADAVTGRVKRRLLKSSYSSNYETYRFINSSASWSPDGKELAFVAKRGPRDVLVIMDVDRNREIRHIDVDLNGMSTPSWSPDGTQIVFTGFDGGISDLFVINADGSGLRRLTNDKYADFHPVWSPDGRTIAFATDRGPDTDFQTLHIGNLRIALLNVESGRIDLLSGMDHGKNVNPQWAPDGRSIAFISDRTGVSDLFLYDLVSGRQYQLTNLFTGAQGITPISPAISWAHGADRLAFVYYEEEKYDVYGVDNPRSLRKKPYRQPTDTTHLIAGDTTRPNPAFASVPRPGSQPDSLTDSPTPVDGTGDSTQASSLYRTPLGFRDTDVRPVHDTTTPAPVSIAALLDSAELSLPDTSEFAYKKYRVHYTPDYVGRPTIGYARDNFGSGVFGGSTIVLSDLLGNHSLIFSGFVNGRISEAQVDALYLNQAHRINWAAGFSQAPYYFFEPSEVILNSPDSTQNTLVTNLRRLVVRSATIQAFYPLSRFRRVEGSFSATNVHDAVQSILEPYSKTTGFATVKPIVNETARSGVNYIQPSVALVFDNSLNGYVGPFYGRRSRLEVAQAVGTWRFTQGLVDYRRYDHLIGPFTLASRVLYFGRFGRDADQFLTFLGHTDLLRGNTSGSYQRHECVAAVAPGTQTGCVELDRLVGSQIGLASAELRFPLLNASLGFLPIGFPPIEGAFFYDAGIAWDGRSTLKFTRSAGDDPIRVRTPLQTIGASIRTNVLGIAIVRVDYSIPQNRPGVKGYWTISLGPTF
ncbi:MAG: BamA/TamA family outer membrane protein [Gemmatimonadota bacterium]